jgi:hypothetical protein
MKTEIQPWEKEAFLRVETILYLVLLWNPSTYKQTEGSGMYMATLGR